MGVHFQGSLRSTYCKVFKNSFTYIFWDFSATHSFMGHPRNAFVFLLSVVVRLPVLAVKARANCG